MQRPAWAEWTKYFFFPWQNGTNSMHTFCKHTHTHTYTHTQNPQRLLKICFCVAIVKKIFSCAHVFKRVRKTHYASTSSKVPWEFRGVNLLIWWFTRCNTVPFVVFTGQLTLCLHQGHHWQGFPYLFTWYGMVTCLSSSILFIPMRTKWIKMNASGLLTKPLFWDRSWEELTSSTKTLAGKGLTSGMISDH